MIDTAASPSVGSFGCGSFDVSNQNK